VNVVQNMNAAKAYRKLKEVEEKKLSNRITLLKLELQKSLHKIEETRKRTDDILNHRSKINERNKQKEEELMRRQREIEAAQMINHNIRSRMSDYRQVRRSFVRIVLAQLGACQTKGPFSGVFIHMTVLMLAIICPIVLLCYL
jgi:chromosome segregation ATPase